MRIGVVYESCANAYYRAIYPARVLEMRGHEVVWPAADGRADPKRLGGCDLIHVYRRAAEDTRRLLADFGRRGAAITYDNDDDFTTFPKESPDYKKVGGAIGQRIFAETVKAARMARGFTTTSEVLAQKYREAGVENVTVIANYVAPGSRPRKAHDGVVVGWVAGHDHAADLVRIDIVDALRRLVAKHRNVRVECVGLDLRLPERYTHLGIVPFERLYEIMGRWDIGIAPLSDIPFNQSRSDIKVKEYAASGLVWLASPRTPYAGLGEAQGGWLVEDDRWLEALDRMVSHPLKRWRLARRAKAWGSMQTITGVADRWEAHFTAALAGR